MLRECCKFFAGVTFYETIVHASFALGGALPLTIFGITITPELNAVQIILPAVITLILIYFGWIRPKNHCKERSHGASGTL